MYQRRPVHSIQGLVRFWLQLSRRPGVSDFCPFLCLYGCKRRVISNYTIFRNVPTTSVAIHVVMTGTAVYPRYMTSFNRFMSLSVFMINGGEVQNIWIFRNVWMTSAGWHLREVCIQFRPGLQSVILCQILCQLEILCNLKTTQFISIPWYQLLQCEALSPYVAIIVRYSYIIFPLVVE